MPVWLPLRPKSRLITRQSPLQTPNIPEEGGFISRAKHVHFILMKNYRLTTGR